MNTQTHLIIFGLDCHFELLLLLLLLVHVVHWQCSDCFVWMYVYVCMYVRVLSVCVCVLSVCA